MKKIDMLYQFLEINGIQPNLPKDEAYKVQKCPNCNNDKVYPLALCDLSEVDNVDRSWGMHNLSSAKVYITCLNCLNEFEEKHKSFSIFFTNPNPESLEQSIFQPISSANANFFFGVQTYTGTLHKGIITEDMFISSEESEIYKEIKENPLRMASQYRLEYRLLQNKINNLKTQHKKEMDKKVNWTIFLTAIVVAGIMFLF